MLEPTGTAKKDKAEGWEDAKAAGPPSGLSYRLPGLGSAPYRLRRRVDVGGSGLSRYFRS